MAMNVGLVALGSGDETIEKAFKEATRYYNGKIGMDFGFNDPSATCVMAFKDDEIYILKESMELLITSNIGMP